MSWNCGQTATEASEKDTAKLLEEVQAMQATGRLGMLYELLYIYTKQATAVDESERT